MIAIQKKRSSTQQTLNGLIGPFKGLRVRGLRPFKGPRAFFIESNKEEEEVVVEFLIETQMQLMHRKMVLSNREILLNHSWTGVPRS